MYNYAHGGNAVYENGHENTIDLSANINPLGMPRKVKAALTREIPSCTYYPDSTSGKLREKISEYENVAPEWIFCGNGASDIIFRLPRAAQAKKIMITAPAFSDYDRAALSIGAVIHSHTLKAAAEFELDDGIAEAARNEKPDLIYLCNPNNPTGKLIKTGLIEVLLKSSRDSNTLVAMDECFLGFTEKADEQTSKKHLNNYPNLIIIKAFTKLFALPGIRLGYAITSNKALIGQMHSHGPDWPVSNLAQTAGIAALEDSKSYIKQTVRHISAERTKIEKELTRLGYTVYKAEANYVFLQNPYPYDLREELDKKGIRIRSCGNYSGLDGTYYRIAVSTKENNAKLLAAIANYS